MNPGYATCLSISIVIILLSTGWRKQLFGDIKRSVILVWLVVWCLSIGIAIQIGQTMIHLSLIVWLCAGICALWQMRSLYAQAQLLAVSSLLAAVLVCVQFIFIHEPAIQWVHPFFTMDKIGALLVFIFYRHPVRQIACLVFGFTGVTFILVFLEGHLFAVSNGMIELYDHWWTAFLIARLFSFVYESVIHLGALSFQRFREWRASKLVGTSRGE